MRDRTRFALKQALTIFLLIGTLALRIVPRDAVDAPRTLLLDCVMTAGAPADFLSRSLFRLPSAILHFGASREELQERVDQLTAQLAAKESQLQKARQELDSLRGFRTTPLAQAYLSWSGELVGYIRGGDTSVFSRSYVVNLGRRSGVARGFPVVWGCYAVGVVSEAGERYSRVRVLGDPVSRVAVRFGGSRHQGVLVGSGRQTCTVRFVSNRVEEGEVKPGNFVFTSGADQIFPPDLVVGRVTRFFRRPSQPSADVEVELAVDFSRIENCVVLARKGSPPGD